MRTSIFCICAALVSGCLTSEIPSDDAAVGNAASGLARANHSHRINTGQRHLLHDLEYNNRVADDLDRHNPYDLWWLEDGGCEDAFIDLASREGGDTVLVVYADNGSGWELIDFNDDCKGSTNSCLQRAFDVGTDYLFAATSHDYLVSGKRPKFSYELEAFCRDEPEPQLCGSRGLADCADGFYCDWEDSESGSVCGADDRPGVCKPMPEICPLDFSPVCGCDGETYSNECFAARAGVDVAAEGECESPGQGVGETCGGIAALECADGLVCNYGDNIGCNIADMAGVCVDPNEPVFCLEIFDPVCGCDGQTYSNDCERRVAGVPLAHDGACDAPATR